jgi:arsenite methyltransferase
MAALAPQGFDAERLRDTVRATYERVARDPFGTFHFHRGAAYAVEYLAYDAKEIASLPRIAIDRFAGVGNPLLIGRIEPGWTVLDHACGSGTDLLLAARRVGPTGRAIGVDMTPGMLQAAERAVRQAGLADRVEVRAGTYEDLPVEDESVDVVISNGVVNLAPDKRRVFGEIWRVLRPGGRLYLADVAVARELKLEVRQQPELWAACIAGALPESQLESLTRELGFAGGTVLAHFRSFEGSSAQAKVNPELRVHGVNFVAYKPPAPPSSSFS